MVSSLSSFLLSSWPPHSSHVPSCFGGLFFILKIAPQLLQVNRDTNLSTTASSFTSRKTAISFSTGIFDKAIVDLKVLLTRILDCQDFEDLDVNEIVWRLRKEYWERKDIRRLAGEILDLLAVRGNLELGYGIAATSLYYGMSMWKVGRRIEAVQHIAWSVGIARRIGVLNCFLRKFGLR